MDLTERQKPRWSRRLWIGGTALGVTGVAAGALYRVSPNFWRQYGRELGRPIATPPRRPDPRKWPDKGLHAAWLGHTTVLVKIDGFTILTDPVFSDRAGVNIGPLTLGIKRLVEPALRLAQLPRIDLILLSHAHMDHFDVPSLRRLESRKVPVVTAWETSDLLRVDRYRAVHELRWGSKVQVGPASIRAVEVKHWGARMRSDTYRGYNGYVIEAGRHRVLFGGDTGETHVFRELHSARGFDLAIMPIGAYNPWIRNHCSPEQAWRMGNEAAAEFFIPVHHQTFALGREPRTEPIERFLAAAGSGYQRVAVRTIGAEFHLA